MDHLNEEGSYIVALLALLAFVFVISRLRSTYCSLSEEKVHQHLEYEVRVVYIRGHILPHKSVSAIQALPFISPRNHQFNLDKRQLHSQKSSITKMPFPTDEQLMKTAAGLLEGFQSLFGKHPGFRPGILPPTFVRRLSTNSCQHTQRASSSRAPSLQHLRLPSSLPQHTLRHLCRS